MSSSRIFKVSYEPEGLGKFEKITTGKIPEEVGSLNGKVTGQTEEECFQDYLWLESSKLVKLYGISTSLDQSNFENNFLEVDLKQLKLYLKDYLDIIITKIEEMKRGIVQGGPVSIYDTVSLLSKGQSKFYFHTNFSKHEAISFLELLYEIETVYGGEEQIKNHPSIRLRLEGSITYEIK